MTRIIWQSIKD